VTLAKARYARAVRPVPTAPVAAGSLIAGFAVAAGTGSRALGGIVLLCGGLWCLREWTRRHGASTALALGAFGLAAFAASHVLAPALGAWPSVLLLAAAMAAVAWTRADTRRCSP
jgi:ABC-type Na+ efflux pump permease subunit